jgi:hypothetical protein
VSAPRLSFEKRLKIAVRALHEFASWDEGAEVTGSFDEPGTAKAARRALAEIGIDGPPPSPPKSIEFATMCARIDYTIETPRGATRRSREVRASEDKFVAAVERAVAKARDVGAYNVVISYETGTGRSA